MDETSKKRIAQPRSLASSDQKKKRPKTSTAKKKGQPRKRPVKQGQPKKRRPVSSQKAPQKRKVTNKPRKRSSGAPEVAIKRKPVRKKKRPVKRRKRISLPKIIVSSILLAGLIIGTIALSLRFKLVEISDDTMHPTLAQTERVLVDSQATPQRHDIVLTEINQNDYRGQFIGRVAALPGDSIWTDGQTVFINPSIEEAIALRPQTYATQLPTGTFSFTVTNSAVLQELQNLTNIPSNQFLLFNDDFSESSDSRSFGLVDGRRMMGVATQRVWPLNNRKRL